MNAEKRYELFRRLGRDRQPGHAALAELEQRDAAQAIGQGLELRRQREQLPQGHLVPQQRRQLRGHDQEGGRLGEAGEYRRAHEIEHPRRAGDAHHHLHHAREDGQPHRQRHPLRGAGLGHADQRSANEHRRQRRRAHGQAGGTAEEDGHQHRQQLQLAVVVVGGEMPRVCLPQRVEKPLVGRIDHASHHQRSGQRRHGVIDRMVEGRDAGDDLDRVIDALADVDASGSLSTIDQAIANGNRGVEQLPGKHGSKRSQLANFIVVIEDRPGELARLFNEITEIGINIEDLKLEHSPGAQIGLVELSVLPESEAKLTEDLLNRGWRLA